MQMNDSQRIPASKEKVWYPLSFDASVLYLGSNTLGD